MRISSIEYENFRNFKDYGKITFSTDGKVSIIYGKNGDGKTTLHQLLQWIFYGNVKFNKTTTDHLYNLQYQRNVPFGSVFEVMGCVDFEHMGIKYSLKRIYNYKNGVNDAEKIGEDLILQYMDSDYNWKKVDNPNEFIEKVLPSGLSEYFFFDGESMIADLRVKGRDSANKLRKALYSMFDLDILEYAISHIGKTDLKTTALGKLYLSKGTILSGKEINATKINIENAQSKLEEYEKRVYKDIERTKFLKRNIKEISEQIGGQKSKADYEKQRKKLKQQRDLFLNSIIEEQVHFGNDVYEMFPRLLISKAVNDAEKKIHLKIEENKLPTGLSKRLITYLLSNSTSECICGHHLGDEEKSHIRKFLELLPPNSYSNLYQEFKAAAKHWAKGYDVDRIEKYISNSLNYEDQARACDIEISELDEREKSSADIEDLIINRQKAEIEVENLEHEIIKLKTEIKKLDIYKKKQMQQFDNLTKENDLSKKIVRKIEIMENVASYFKNILENASINYSKLLQNNIQDLIDDMLTSKRNVTVTPEFSVRVVDSFNDESKSEGQFAVVSFAYIGGILKMLINNKSLEGKEYPLVLDGPFSQLDADQRQNVINKITDFAPQVILFSKDHIHDLFDAKYIGKIWTIQSNEEKNIASVEEGFLWS